MAVVCSLVVPGVCLAQASTARPARTNTQIIDFILDFQEQHLTRVAEIMPGEKSGQLVESLRMNGMAPPASGVASGVDPGRPESSISQALDFWITNTEKEVTSAANAMPEEKYSFAPTGGEFHGVRTFGEQVKHLAANNYRMAARIVGQEATPDQEAETGPDSVRSKAEIMQYLRGSFVALHESVAAITSANAVTPVWPNRVGTSKQNTRLQFAVDAIAHSYDHYGQMVEYLRMNGIIPPASR
jgi:uncharacterized damage-inducible protein DinB